MGNYKKSGGGNSRKGRGGKSFGKGGDKSYPRNKPYTSHAERDEDMKSERKSYSDDKPFKKKRDDDRGDKKSFGEKRSYSDDKPFKKKYGNERDEKKSYSDKKSFGEKRSYSEDKPYKKKYDEDRGEKKSYGDKKPFGEKRSYSDNKPFRKKYGSDRDDKKSYGDKKPFGEKRSYSDDKPFRKKYGSDSDDKKSYGDKKPFGGKTPYGEKRSRPDDKPFRKKYEDERGEKKSYEKKHEDEKPVKSRSYSGGPRISPNKTDEEYFRDKPDRKPQAEEGDEQENKRPASEKEERKERGGVNYGKPFKKKYEKSDSDDFKKEKKSFYKKHEDEDFGEEGSFPKKISDKKTKPSPLQKEVDSQIRLNKYIANAGICSRREADELIAAGAVTVNGKVITEMGHKISPGDIVNYGGGTIKTEKKIYLLLNKPKDYITTVDDPQARRTVMELIAGACKERLYPVGRLDRNTTGVLLFTNDGDLTKRLTHPSFEAKKIYQVSLNMNLRGEDFRQIMEGIELEDGEVKVDDISFVGEGSDRKEIGIEIHSGKNRVVRRIFEKLGYEVLKLDRVYFAGLTKKDLPRGRWRFLSEKEIGFLKMVK